MIAIRSITLLSTLAISPAVFSGSAGQVFIDSANVISDCKILQDKSDSNNRYVVPLTKELTCQPDESRRDGKSLGYTIACKYSDNVKRVVSTNKQHGFKTVDDYITIGFHFRDSDYLIGEFTKKLAEEKIKVIYAAKSQCLGTASEIIEPYPVGSCWLLLAPVGSCWLQLDKLPMV